MYKYSTQFSLRHKRFVLLAVLLVLVGGGYRVSQLSLDILPDIAPPVVTITAKAPGLMPEEVERLVVSPLETAINRASGIHKVRSTSFICSAVVWAEFAEGTGIRQAHQLISEKLTSAVSSMPPTVKPTIATHSSPVEIMVIGIRSLSGNTSTTKIRSHCERLIRPRLLALPGVSRVTLVGGGQQQYQVLTTPQRLAQYRVTLDDLVRAVQNITATAGGILPTETQHRFVRIVGEAHSAAEIENCLVAQRDNEPPVLVKHVAQVQLGSSLKKNDGSIDGQPAVICSVYKQPGVDTVALTNAIIEKLQEFQRALPRDVKIDRNMLRQSDCIETVKTDLMTALGWGATIAMVLLLLLSRNWRLCIAAAVYFPLPIILSLLLVDQLTIGINFVTITGIAVATIASVIDFFSQDSRCSSPMMTLVAACPIIPVFFFPGVEGKILSVGAVAYLAALLCSLVCSMSAAPVLAYFAHRGETDDVRHAAWHWRILRQNNARQLRFIRGYPILALSVLLIAIASSIVWLIPGKFFPSFQERSFVVETICESGTSLAEASRIGGITANLLREIPEVATTIRRTGWHDEDENYLEGTHYSKINVLWQRDRVGVVSLKRQGELTSEKLDEITEKLKILLGKWNFECWQLDFVPAAAPGESFPKRERYDVVVRWRKSPDWAKLREQIATITTGANLYIDAVEKRGRSYDEIDAIIHERIISTVPDAVSTIPGVVAYVGRPVSLYFNRLRGVDKKQVEIAIFGSDLTKLRSISQELVISLFPFLAPELRVQEPTTAIQPMDQPGIVQLETEAHVQVPEVRIHLKHEALRQHNFQGRPLVETIQAALHGREIAQIREGQYFLPVVVGFVPLPNGDLDAIRRLPIQTPAGSLVLLQALADVTQTTTPQKIHHENLSRRIVLTFNLRGVDWQTTDRQIIGAIETRIVPHLPPGYSLEYTDRRKQQSYTSSITILLALTSFYALVLVLGRFFASGAIVFQTILAVAFSLSGSIIAMWIAGVSISLASCAALIAVALIAIRCTAVVDAAVRYEKDIGSRQDYVEKKPIFTTALTKMIPVLLYGLLTIAGVLPLFWTTTPFLPFAVAFVGGMVAVLFFQQALSPILLWR